MRRLLILVIVTACSAAALQARQAATTPVAPQPAQPAPALQAPPPPPPVPVAPTPSAPNRPRSAAQATTQPAQGRGVPVPTTPTAPAPPPPPAAPAPPRKLPTQNVRFDVTITDTFGTGPSKKTVSMLVADTRQGQIRSSMQIPQALSTVSSTGAGVTAPITNFSYTTIVLNIDATPEVLTDGRIFVTMNVQYTPDTAQEPGGSKKPGSLNEALAVVLSDAKQTLISQSADPQGDRKVTLEVTATVVR